MSGTISLKEVLTEIELSVSKAGDEKPFDISFYKFSTSDKAENGKLVSYSKCVKAGLPPNIKDKQRKSIRLVSTGQRKNFNIFLIDSFNGKKVKW